MDPRRPILLLFPGFLAGCGHCEIVPFAEIVVTDPEGSAEVGFVEAVAQAIADFASGTGREGTCIEEVQLVPEIVDDGYEWGGWTRYHKGRIYISTVVDDAYRMTTHELCHALDHEEDFSGRWSDLEEDSRIDPDRYPTHKERRRETFARACEEGPLEIEPDATFSETCDLHMFRYIELSRHLQQEVWTEGPRATFGEPNPIGFGEPVSIEATLEGGWIRAVGGYKDAVVLVVRAHPGAIPEQAILVDPETGATLASVDLPTPRGSDRTWQVVAGADGPWLAFFGQEVRLWRWDLEAGRVEERGRVALREGERAGPLALHAGVLYYGSWERDTNTVRAQRLAGGGELDLDLDPEIWGDYVAVETLEEGVGGVLMQSAGEGLHRWLPRQRRWEDLGMHWRDWVPSTVPQADGRRLGYSTLRWREEGEDVHGLSFFVWSPEDASWHLPEDPCATLLRDARTQAVVSAGGRVWRLERSAKGVDQLVPVSF